MKVCVAAVLLLLAPAAFAQEVVYTSEGEYFAGIEYEGQYCGQQTADTKVDNAKSYPDAQITTGIRLTKGQWECAHKMLGKYTIRKGDTFSIHMIPFPNYVGNSFTVVCEFTSGTQYTYWAWRSYVRR